jgi:hypothetical protein
VSSYDLPEVTAPLNPKVAPLVEALRRDGFPTTASGYTPDDELFCAWVNVAAFAPRLNVATTQGMRLALSSWLRHRHIEGRVCEVHLAVLGEEPWQPWLRVEILGDLPAEEALA